MPIKLAFTFFLVFLSGCSSFNTGDLSQVSIAENVSLKLTAPGEALANQSKQQLLTINYGGKSNQLIAQLEFTTKGTTLVGVSPQGLPLFELVFIEGEKFQQKQYIEFEMLPLATIISDIQLVYWPLKQLNASITGAQAIEHHQGQVRNIESNGNIIISIIKGADKISYQHFQRGYKLTITSLEQ